MTSVADDIAVGKVVPLDGRTITQESHPELLAWLKEVTAVAAMGSWSDEHARLYREMKAARAAGDDRRHGELLARTRFLGKHGDFGEPTPMSLVEPSATEVTLWTIPREMGVMLGDDGVERPVCWNSYIQAVATDDTPIGTVFSTRDVVTGFT